MLHHNVRRRALSLASAVLIPACQEEHDLSAADSGSPSDESAGLERTHELAAGGTHACALRKAGLYCWGENFLGQLGTGDLVDSASAIAARVAGTDVVDVAVATGRTCVRRRSGQVACWGSNQQGQIGDGTRTDSLQAVAAVGIDDAAELAITDSSTCIARRDGRVACWGNADQQDASAKGELPATVAGLTGIVELVSAGDSGYCGRDEAGTVTCWRFDEGQWTRPETIAKLTGARTIAMSHTQVVCGVAPSSKILCHNAGENATVSLQNSEGFLKLSAGDLVACAIDGSGRGRCWNVMPQFQLEVPSEIPLLEIAISGLSVCVLRRDKSVACAQATDLAPVPIDVALPD